MFHPGYGVVAAEFKDDDRWCNIGVIVLREAYFFTVTLRDRHAMTLVEYVDVLRTAMARTLREQPFAIDAMAVLPDHLHAVWTLPPGY